MRWISVRAPKRISALAENEIRGGVKQIKYGWGEKRRREGPAGLQTVRLVATGKQQKVQGSKEGG